MSAPAEAGERPGTPVLTGNVADGGTNADGAAADSVIDLLVLGDCNPDVIVAGGDLVPAFGQQEKLVEAIALVVGGSAAITAAAGARLGLRVALVAAVGDDPAGQYMLGQLAGEGVGISGMAVRSDLPTGMTVVLSRVEDRAILTATGAIGALSAADVPGRLLARARHVHVSSYFLLEHSLGPGLPALLARARAAGTTTSQDTNWDPAQVWGGDGLAAVLAQTDLLLPNEEEALRISGAADLDAAVTALTSTGGAVAVKRGARGAMYADGTRRHIASLAPVDAVDATGAGDCFNAGLLTGRLRGLEVPAALALGCAVGAMSTKAPGGTGSSPNLASALDLARRVTIRRLA
jgi:sugar/nucleoside kinase (ribokinase family)